MSKIYNYKVGEILLVDKPLTWSSFQVVNKLRWKMKNVIGIKNIKVGHAGTLDPLATGLLILCTGKKTKTIDTFMGLEKSYSGTITVGSTRPSYDMESEIDATFPTEHITDDLIKLTAEKMVGDYDQMPPIFSAKKVNGKRAYAYARAGEEVILQPKLINISKFEITKIDGLNIDFIINCSKGTYIRSIAHDFGKLIESGGHLSGLRREKIGDYDVKDAKSVEEWLEEIESAEFEHDFNN
jgi:tRNA pseudouridine55 synthase